MIFSCCDSVFFMSLARYTVAESECRMVLFGMKGTDSMSFFMATAYCWNALAT